MKHRMLVVTGVVAALTSCRPSWAQGPILDVATVHANTLHLTGSKLTFCVANRAKQIDLDMRGPPQPAEGRCRKAFYIHTCEDPGFFFQVRSPGDRLNDIIDLEADSVLIDGHVADCDTDGKTLAIVTTSQVLIIDAKTAKTEVVANTGGNRVAINQSWIAWSQNSQLYARQR